VVPGDQKPIKKAQGEGARLHEVSHIPHALRQETQARWGVNINITTSRENGRYSGPVFATDAYIVQRIGEKTAVFHRWLDVDFSASPDLQRRALERRLNDVTLQIRYDGRSGRAQFHDPERANIEEMFARIRKAAEGKISDKKAFGLFVAQLDIVRSALIDRHREQRNRAFAERTSGRTNLTTSEHRTSVQ